LSSSISSLSSLDESATQPDFVKSQMILFSVIDETLIHSKPLLATILTTALYVRCLGPDVATFPLTNGACLPGSQ